MNKHCTGSFVNNAVQPFRPTVRFRRIRCRVNMTNAQPFKKRGEIAPILPATVRPNTLDFTARFPFNHSNPLFNRLKDDLRTLVWQYINPFVTCKITHEREIPPFLLNGEDVWAREIGMNVLKLFGGLEIGLEEEQMMLLCTNAI